MSKKTGDRKNIYFVNESLEILEELSQKYDLTYSKLIKLLLINEKQTNQLEKVLNNLEKYKWNVKEYLIKPIWTHWCTVPTIHFGGIQAWLTESIKSSFLGLKMDSITKASLMDIRIPLKNIIEKEVEMKMDAEDTLELMSIIEGGGLLKNENPVEKLDLKRLYEQCFEHLTMKDFFNAWVQRNSKTGE